KGLQGRLNLLPKHGTLLIGLHGLKRVPHPDGKAAVRIIHTLGHPPPAPAWPLFSRHGRPISLLIFLPTAGPQFPPRNPHNHLESSGDCAAQPRVKQKSWPEVARVMRDGDQALSASVSADGGGRQA